MNNKIIGLYLKDLAGGTQTDIGEHIVWLADSLHGYILDMTFIETREEYDFIKKYANQYKRMFIDTLKENLDLIGVNGEIDIHNYALNRLLSLLKKEQVRKSHYARLYLNVTISQILRRICVLERFDFATKLKEDLL